MYISVMMHFWPPRCVTMMKRVLLYIVPFSLTASLFGCIFVSRSNKNQAVSILEHCGKELKDRGVSVYCKKYSLQLLIDFILVFIIKFGWNRCLFIFFHCWDVTTCVTVVFKGTVFGLFHMSKPCFRWVWFNNFFIFGPQTTCFLLLAYREYLFKSFAWVCGMCFLSAFGFTLIHVKRLVRGPKLAIMATCILHELQVL